MHPLTSLGIIPIQKYGGDWPPPSGFDDYVHSWIAAAVDPSLQDVLVTLAGG